MLMIFMVLMEKSNNDYTHDNGNDKDMKDFVQLLLSLLIMKTCEDNDDDGEDDNDDDGGD